MHLGVVAVAQPVPVVDALVAVARSACGRAGRGRRRRELGHCGESRRRGVARRSASTLDRRWSPLPTPTRCRASTGRHADRRTPTPSSTRVAYNADGLVPAIVQEAGTGEVLMVGWMNREALRAHARDRPHVVLEPEPPGVLVQGRDVGRPPVRARGAATTATWTCCCSSSSRRAGARATPASAAASSARSAAAPRPGPCEPDRDRVRPSRRRVRRAGARLHGRAGVARGARRPRDAGVGVREARRRRRGLPARVGRARRALGPVLVPRPRPGAHAGRRAGSTVEWSTATPPDGVPTDQGALAALEALLARVPRAARSPSCRRSTAASSAGSATTSCARSSACPNVPPDDLGLARRGAARSPVTSPRSTTSASGST